MHPSSEPGIPEKDSRTRQISARLQWYSACPSSIIPAILTLLLDYEKFSFSHAQKPYLEFPILESGSYTDDESPGADRVVIGSISSDYSSAVFCAVLTHDGSTKNGFTECQDDTVNTSGKGTYEKKTGGRGTEPGEGRKLLDRIDIWGLAIAREHNTE